VYRASDSLECVCARPGRMAFAALKQMSLYGKHIAVFGSERPWLEACALAAGAEKVVTIEYSHIISHHPSIEVITPEEAGRRWSNGSLLFDAVASFSSLEHAGLGRYGDKMNPWGDIVAVGQAWCITRGDGLLLLAEPMAEQDVVLWNEARIYGPVMSPHLLANWEQVCLTHPHRLHVHTHTHTHTHRLHVLHGTALVVQQPFRCLVFNQGNRAAFSRIFPQWRHIVSAPFLLKNEQVWRAPSTSAAAAEGRGHIAVLRLY